MSHVSFRNRENSARWFNKPLWFENLVYERDGAPDNPALDYLWSPGFSSVGMKQGDVLYVVLSEEPVKYSVDEIETLERESLDEIRAFVEDAPIDSQYSAVSDMVQSSYHLVADQKDASYAIFSGFPSVEQRARDTFVAFPGLSTGAVDEVLFVEVKTGNAALSKVERSLRDAVEKKNVRYTEYRIPIHA